MTKKIILFNGPPGSGKDHAANFVKNNFDNVRVDKFARILKERTHALYGFSWRPWNYYEDCKDIANKDFYGLTPRQAYINVSETYFKPMHNERIFGEMLLRDIETRDFDILAISDSGFVEEVEVLIEKYGAENVMLVKIFREGYNFSSDSRSYIELPGIKITTTIPNKGDSNFTRYVYDLVKQFITNSISEFGPLIESVPGLPCTQTFNESRMWPEARDYYDNDAKPAVLAEFIPNIQDIKYDENDKEKDYVFEDVINGKPSLLERLSRLIGIK